MLYIHTYSTLSPIHFRQTAFSSFHSLSPFHHTLYFCYTGLKTMECGIVLRYNTYVRYLPYLFI